MRSPSHPALRCGIQEYRQRLSRTFGKLIPHFFIITFLVCSIAPDAVSQSSRTPMRDSGISAKVIPRSDAGSRNTRLGHSALDAESRNTGRSTCKIHSLYVPFSGPRITCGVTRFSTRHPGYTRCLYPKKTAGSTVRASRDARSVRPESPFSFPAKEKGSQKKAPG